MEAKHTPGPWSIESAESALDHQMEHWIQVNNEDLCRVNSYEDARLIAAAPELLSALKYALEALDDLRVRHTIQSMAITAARAAIAKATGEGMGEKQEPVDIDLLDDARAVLEIIVHEEPGDTFRDARALIPKLRERLGLPPIINFTHPQPKREPLADKPVRIYDYVWPQRDEHKEECVYACSYTPGQHLARGELLAVVHPSQLKNAYLQRDN